MGFFSRLNFKPSNLKLLCETEPKSHKIRIIVFSIALSFMAGSYEYIYSNQSWRINQLQQRALAGMKGYEFTDYIPPNSIYLWYAKNEVDVLNEKSFKDLVYITHGWKSRVVDGEAVGPQEENDGGWFTQKQRYDAWAQNVPEGETAEQRAKRIVRQDA